MCVFFTPSRLARGPENLRPESYAGERGRVRTRVPMATIFCSGWPRQEAGKSFRETPLLLS